NQLLQFFLACDVARDHRCLASLRADTGRNFLAHIGLAAGDHHLRAVLGHPLGDRPADALAGAGNHSDLARQIELRRHPASFAAQLPISMLALWKRQSSLAWKRNEPRSISTPTSRACCIRPASLLSAPRPVLARSVSAWWSTCSTMADACIR